MGRWSRIASVALACFCSCSDDAPAIPSQQSEDAGAKTCSAGRLTLPDGSCQDAGIPASACAPGFTPENDGCTAVLPSTACASGTMAVPGETACREVSPCGDGAWGTIPVDATTQFVDGAYAGGGSDGSRSKPWTRVADAVTAAAPGAIVAIAAGTYAETLTVSKRVRLWGRCPRLVEIAGTGPTTAAVTITTSGVELRALAVRGAGGGVFARAARDVVVDQAWIHALKGPGILIGSQSTSGAVTVTGSLIEQTGDLGVQAYTGEVVLEKTAIREIRPDAQGLFGTALEVDALANRPGKATVRGCLFEKLADNAVASYGGELVVESTAIRGTAPAGDGNAGHGIGLSTSSDGKLRSSLTLRASTVEASHDAVVVVHGADANIEATVLRDTKANQVDQYQGYGVLAVNDETTGARSTLTVRASLVERTTSAGFVIAGTDATLEGVLVRDVALEPAEKAFGRGISLQEGHKGMAATATLRGCKVERVFEAGVFVASSAATIESVLVRGVQANPAGNLGDGISLLALGADGAGKTSATVKQCSLLSNARAGISNFSGSIEIGSSTLEDNAFDLDGEENEAGAFTFRDLGGNTCKASGSTRPCQVSTSKLTPPVPIEL